jgi:hypothetical protein
VTTHLKDVAVDAYDEGILLSEVILGEGLIDLPRAVQLIRKARPGTRMNLEMITRSPLKVPMLTEGYWTTLQDKSGLDLARTLRFVMEHKTQIDLPQAEDQNVMDCLNAWQLMNLLDFPRTSAHAPRLQSGTH